LSSLRQSFLNGSLTRLVDTDSVLRGKITEFVEKGDFGLASGAKPDGTYNRLWFEELVSSDEVNFDANVFLLTKSKANSLKAKIKGEPVIEPGPIPGPEPVPGPEAGPQPGPEATTPTLTLRVIGTIPSEMWNRLGTRIIPKLRSASDLKVGVDFSVTVDTKLASSLQNDLRQALEDLGLGSQVKIERQG
ncbi:MAG: AAA family ATPase, partial [Candidatus Binatia bacterium]